jgi:hypothetical protein
MAGKSSGRNRPRQAAAKAPPFLKPKTDPALAGKVVQEAQALFQQHWGAGDFAQARRIVEQLLRQYPQVPQAWSDAAACSVHLKDWDKVIEYGQEACRRDPDILSAIDGLAQAYDHKGDWAKARHYGHLALVKRDERFGHKFFCDWQVAPPPPFSKDRTRNLLAFSLFGENPKYCESGILNVVEQPALYPDWTCRFYVDDTVPAQVLERLSALGAQVVRVDDELKTWPAPMWRFAAYDDPNIDRVIFRDADSVISAREAGAVAEWVSSGQAFHMMRDYGSHTELLMAGLWGVTRGALPPMRQMAADYLKVPPSSLHFADQYFLREYVWPYARQHILQHDSMFDFMQPRPFPQGPHQAGFHTGCLDASAFFEVTVDRPDGARVSWTMFDCSGAEQREVCRYEATVRAGKITVAISDRYAKRINRDFVVRVKK